MADFTEASGFDFTSGEVLDEARLDALVDNTVYLRDRSDEAEVAPGAIASKKWLAHNTPSSMLVTVQLNGSIVGSEYHTIGQVRQHQNLSLSSVTDGTLIKVTVSSGNAVGHAYIVKRQNHDRMTVIVSVDWSHRDDYLTCNVNCHLIATHRGTRFWSA